MARGSRSCLCIMLVVSLLVNAFCIPAGSRDRYRPYRDDLEDDNMDLNDQVASASQTSSTTVSSFDDDEDFGESNVAPSNGGGSNLISLLNLATALFPGSSSITNSAIRNMIKQYLIRKQKQDDLRRKDVADNIIEIDYIKTLTPPFQRQEDDKSDSNGDDHDDDDDDDDNSSESESEEHNDAAEESVENNQDDNNSKASKQDSNGDNSEDDNDSDYSDEPESDGQGGGVLGILAGLSGGEDGSDLGTLLATVSQIVVSLSGDGFDLNAVLASGFGLFVGLLSEGEENPGSIIASYLLTSLDTITGGGANNNGAFFGNLLSKLVKGTSMSGASSSGQQDSDEQVSPLWTLKMTILRAFLQFGTSIIGLASSSSVNASTL